jgi:hypothetical protein
VAITEYRRVADDGREVVVERHEDGFWFVYVDDGDPKHRAGGAELSSGMIAGALGYHIGRDEWPEWIDRWADEIESGPG